MITPKTQTAIAVLKCIYARDYGTCIKQCTLTEGQMRVLLTQLTNAGLIILKEKEHPLEIQSYIPAKKAMEISLLDILEATGFFFRRHCFAAATHFLPESLFCRSLLNHREWTRESAAGFPCRIRLPPVPDRNPLPRRHPVR